MNKKNRHSKNSGYIALISAIVISLSLLSFTIIVSSAGFYSRANASETTDKAVGAILSQGCVHKALLLISQIQNYRPSMSGDIFTIHGNNCTVFSVDYGLENEETHEKNVVIKTQAQYKNTFTTVLTTTSMKNPSVSYGTPAFTYFEDTRSREILGL